MKLTSFGISNFKAFGDSLQRLPLKPLTLVFGPNSAGKSSLIQGLLWTLHSVKEGDFESRVTESASGSIDLGAFRSLLHHKDEERRIEIEFSFSNGVGTPLVRVVHQLGIRTREDLHKIWQELNSKMQIAAEYENTERSRRKAWDLVSRLFNYNEPDFDEVTGIVLNDDACLQQIELSHRRDAELGWGELEGYEDLGGRMPTPMDFVKAYRESQDAAKRLQEISEQHGGALQAHWDSIDRVIEQERHLCSVLAIEIHQGDDLVLRAVRPPGESELEAHVLDEKMAEAMGSPPDAWITSFCLSSSLTGDAVTESIFATNKVRFARHGDLHFVSDQAIAAVSTWLSHTRKNAAELERNLVYLEPLRHMPERRSLIGVPGEPPVDPRLKSWTHLRDKPLLQRQVNALLERMECRKYRFQTNLFSTARDVLTARDEIPSFDSRYWDDEVTTLNQLDEQLKKTPTAAVFADLALFDIENQVAVSTRDVGVGISQMTPILIHACAANKKLIAIEQPELHLHPALQAELSDVFIESALGENKNTFLLETHSEHLILRILRRIRETTEGDFSDWSVELKKACPDGIRPEDVAVLYVKPGEDGAQVETLRINELGEFVDEWPGGFFDERIREIL